MLSARNPISTYLKVHLLVGPIIRQRAEIPCTSFSDERSGSGHGLCRHRAARKLERAERDHENRNQDDDAVVMRTSTAGPWRNLWPS